MQKKKKKPTEKACFLPPCSLQQLRAGAKPSLAAHPMASHLPRLAGVPGAGASEGFGTLSTAAARQHPAGARRQLRPSLPPFDVAAIFIGGRNHLPSTRPCLARSRGDVSPGGCPLLALKLQDGVCEGLAGPWGTRNAQGRCPSQPWGAHVRLLVMSAACFFLFLFLFLLPSLSQGQF